MSCLGVHFAITPAQMERLVEITEDEECDDTDEALHEAVAEIEERWQTKYLHQTDKAWDAIHRTLTLDHTPKGRLDPEAGEPPLNLVIIGGDQLYEGDDYTISLIAPEEVVAVAAALSKVSEAWMRERFFQLKKKNTQYDIDEDQFDYMYSNFKGLPKFFARAANEGRAVIFTADH